MHSNALPPHSTRRGWVLPINTVLGPFRAMRDRLRFIQFVHRSLRKPYYRALEVTFSQGIPLRLASGHRVRLHPRLLGMRPDLYEPSLVSVLAPFVKQGATVVDVGAHVGLHTLLFSKLVGQRGRVIAIEPSPANAHLLRQHVKWNDCDNVTILETAAADRDGVSRFCYRTDPTDPGGFANSMLYDVGGDSTVVSVTTLDHACKGYQPNIVKIDVEGAELAVVRGAKTLLAQSSPPVVIIAMHPEALKLCGAGPSDVCDFLTARGYEGRNLRGELAADPGFEEILFTKS